MPARNADDDSTRARRSSTAAAVSAAASGDVSAGAPEDRHVINPLALHLRTHPGRGRGVFADADVPAGTTLDEAPVLLLSAEQWVRGDLDRTVLGEYGFCWSNGGMAIGLGLASMFNHSPTPNVNYIRNTKAGTITFRTVRRVPAGEEFCICYAADESKLWFTPSGQQARADADDDAPVDPTLAIELDVMDVGEAGAPARPASPAACAAEADGQAAADDAEQRRTRREQGGTTHAGRDARRAWLAAKAHAKAERRAAGETGTADSASGIGGQPAARAAAPSNAVPAVDEAQSSAGAGASALPPPLHSRGGPSRRAPAGPVTLVDAIPFDADAADAGPVPEAEWGVLQRVLGPAELEEAADSEATMDIWTIDVAEPTLIRRALQFIREAGIDDQDMKHLKRITRRRSVGGTEHCLVALSPAAGTPAAALETALAGFDAALGALGVRRAAVPRTPARTGEQTRARSAAGAWPTVFSPGPARRPADARALSAAHLAWVRAGVARVLADAAAAAAAGELPVAVHCAAPPPALGPARPPDGYVAPTPNLRAAAHDTRVSARHPLRHAVLNCVAAVAALRTAQPFADAVPARNGADYLLTALTLFATHEPCVMCCMALLHSRVATVYYVHPSPGGGFEGVYSVHGRKDLNHRFEVWRWRGDPGPPLPLPDGVEV